MSALEYLLLLFLLLLSSSSSSKITLEQADIQQAVCHKRSGCQGSSFPVFKFVDGCSVFKIPGRSEVRSW
jgi:hypothetical protein